MELVKNIRKCVGIKQVEMAESLGIDQSNYCNIENGKLIPNNISEIKEKALDILLPKLSNRIHIEETKLNAFYLLRDEALQANKKQTLK